MVAIISLEDQRIHVYSADGLIASSAISTGAKGYRTPTGVFSVLQKRRYHESNIYSGAPMPWMQRLTWSGIALHGGVVPGYPASHGCIRLTYSFASKMWALTSVGARVIVSPEAAAPADIAHLRLPVPHMAPMPNDIVGRQQRSGPLTVEASISLEENAQRVTMTDRGPTQSTLHAATRRLETPLDRARAARAQARADARAAAKAVRPALMLARRTSQISRRALYTLHRVKAQATAAQARLIATARMVAAAKTQADTIAAGDAENAAREVRDAAQRELADAIAAEEAASTAAHAAAEAAETARAAKARTASTLKSWTNGLDPISILVSRKAGRIFVRQGFAPLLDAPVTIRDVERPLGTHVFTAVAQDKEDGRLRWTVVTVPDAGADFALAAAQRKRGRPRTTDITAASLKPGSASEALDRIDIPEQISKEIADRLWVGASFMISDQGLGGETGLGTDFVVLTK